MTTIILRLLSFLGIDVIYQIFNFLYKKCKKLKLIQLLIILLILAILLIVFISIRLELELRALRMEQQRTAKRVSDTEFITQVHWDAHHPIKNFFRLKSTYNVCHNPDYLKDYGDNPVSIEDCRIIDDKILKVNIVPMNKFLSKNVINMQKQLASL